MPGYMTSDQVSLARADAIVTQLAERVRWQLEAQKGLGFIAAIGSVVGSVVNAFTADRAAKQAADLAKAQSAAQLAQIKAQQQADQQRLQMEMQLLAKQEEVAATQAAAAQAGGLPGWVLPVGAGVALLGVAFLLKPKGKA